MAGIIARPTAPPWPGVQRVALMHRARGAGRAAFRRRDRVVVRGWVAGLVEHLRLDRGAVGGDVAQAGDDRLARAGIEGAECYPRDLTRPVSAGNDAGTCAARARAAAVAVVMAG